MADRGGTWPAQGDCPEEVSSLILKKYWETIKHVTISSDDFDSFPSRYMKDGVDI